MSEIPILSTSVFFIAQQRYRPLSNIVYLQDILFRFHLWYKKTEMCPSTPPLLHPSALPVMVSSDQYRPYLLLSPPLLPPPAHIYAFPVSLPWKCHKKGVTIAVYCGFNRWAQLITQNSAHHGEYWMTCEPLWSPCRRLKQTAHAACA